MQVLLLQNIPKIGKKGEVKNVADGYARNYLLRKNLAKVAVAGTVKSLKKQQEQQQRHYQDKKTEEGKMASRLSEIILKCERPASGTSLFGAIHPGDIAQLLEQQGIRVSHRDITLKKPIKHVGEHSYDVEFQALNKTFSGRIIVVAKS